jgi:hypothetical protein
MLLIQDPSHHNTNNTLVFVLYKYKFLWQQYFEIEKYFYGYVYNWKEKPIWKTCLTAAQEQKGSTPVVVACNM